MTTPTVPVRAGWNTWTLARTDRDGASPEQVRQTAIAAVARALRPLQGAPLPHELLIEPDGVSRIGNARPLRVLSVAPWDAPSIGASGQVLADAQALYPLPYVTASRPWRVVVDFAWRGPDGSVPWPAWRKDIVGHTERSSFDGGAGDDWLLWESVYRGAADAGGGMTWSEAIVDGIERAFTVGEQTLVELAGEAAELGVSASRAATRGWVLVAGGVAAAGLAIWLAKR